MFFQQEDLKFSKKLAKLIEKIRIVDSNRCERRLTLIYMYTLTYK